MCATKAAGAGASDSMLRTQIVSCRAGRLIAALDVFNREPLPPNHPLCLVPNTVLTPHFGYGTQEVLAEFHRHSIENALAFLDGNPIRVYRQQDA
jgi:phosphoglycerate dehydrogenase-like enzyme